MLQLLQLHSGGTSPQGAQPSADAKVVEAKVLRAEEDASRLAAGFMMKAAVTKALHEEQASIMQVSSFCISEILQCPDMQPVNLFFVLWIWELDSITFRYGVVCTSARQIPWPAQHPCG